MAAGVEARAVLGVGRIVQLESVDRRGYRHTHAAAVVGAGPEGLRLRLRGGPPPALPAGARLDLWVEGEGRDDHFMTQAEVTGSAGATLSLAWPGALQRVGRRRYSRVGTGLPVWTTMGDGWLRDLGGGGCSFTLAVSRRRRTLPGVGEAIGLHIPTGSAAIPVTGRVVRVWAQQGRQIYAVAFEALTERHRDGIIRLVVQHERELLRERQRPEPGAPLHPA